MTLSVQNKDLNVVALVNYSWLSKCCTARESSYRFSLVGLTKVKARKYFLFTENFTCIENKEHLLDFVITFILQSPLIRKQSVMSP